MTLKRITYVIEISGITVKDWWYDLKKEETFPCNLPHTVLFSTLLCNPNTSFFSFYLHGIEVDNLTVIYAMVAAVALG